MPLNPIKFHHLNPSEFLLPFGKLTYSRPCQIGVGRLVSTINWCFSGSMFIYHRVNDVSPSVPTASSTFRSSSWIVRSSSAASVWPSVAVPPPELPITATDIRNTRGEAVNNYVGLSINGGSTIYGWLLTCLMENPIKMDLGVSPSLGNLHMFMNQWFLPPHALKSTYVNVCRRRSTGWNPVKWQTVRIGNANSALAFKKS